MSFEEMADKSMRNVRMCQCPICGHTKESTCEYLNGRFGRCKCCVFEGKGVEDQLLRRIRE
jgi:hypothetical protein